MLEIKGSTWEANLLLQIFCLGMFGLLPPGSLHFASGPPHLGVSMGPPGVRGIRERSKRQMRKEKEYLKSVGVGFYQTSYQRF